VRWKNSATTQSQNSLDKSDLLSRKLESGLDTLGVTLSASARSSLLEYCELLIKWNKTFNLTSVDDPEQMISLHLLDSLAVLPFLPGGRVLDVGTGAGLPGIPLAIARPEQAFVLLDSNGKKTRFLVQASGQLGLENVEVVNQRVEQYQVQELFDVIISRAFSSLGQFLSTCNHLVSPGGQFLAMKGKLPEDELHHLPDGFHLVSSVELKVPGLDAERHLLMLRRS
jgi:16S rRNA (guanine527-N7)-methyltransferase